MAKGKDRGHKEKKKPKKSKKKKDTSVITPPSPLRRDN